MSSLHHGKETTSSNVSTAYFIIAVPFISRIYELFFGKDDFLLVKHITIWRYISFHVLFTRITYHKQFQRYACLCNTNNTMKENTTLPWLIHLLLLILFKFPDLKYRCLHLQIVGTNLANKV
jgi:hypothetical protein